MITDEQAEKALDWIRDNASKAAIARSQKESLEDYTSILEATLMGQVDGAEHVKKSHARSHPDFIAHHKAVEIAREEAYRVQYIMKAAEKKIDVWQTQSANNRRMM